MTSLRKKFVISLKWTSLSAVWLITLQIVRLPIVSRILTPEDFGLMAIITLVIGFSQTFSDAGMSSAIIQRQSNTQDELSSLYWLNIISGIIIFIIILISSPIVISFYNQPKLGIYLTWASLIFLITPIGQQFRVLLQKELKFSYLAIIDITSSSIGFITIVFTAYMGYGVLSLIWGQLIISLISSIGLLVVGCRSWPPKFHFRVLDLKGYVRFGGFQLGERSINYFSANTDYLIIGKYLSTQDLGFYTFAYQLVTLPLTKLNPLLTQVAYPIFAKKQNNNNALRKGYLEITKLICLVVFPVLLGLAFGAKLVVPTLFGSKWENAIPLIQVLSVLGILKSLGNISGSILLAKGRSDLGFKWNIFVSFINFTSFLLIIKYGIHSLALLYTGLSFFYLFTINKILISPIIGLNINSYLKIIIKTLSINILFMLIMWLTYNIISGYNLGAFSILAILMLFAFIFYILLYSLFEFNYIKGIFSQLIDKKNL